MEDSFFLLAKKLPRTIEEYYLVLQLSKQKKDNMGSNQNVLRENTAQDLDALFELVEAARSERIGAKTKSLTATKAVQKAVEKLRLFNSHFLQHLFDAIERDEVNVAAKIFYNMELNDAALPLQRKIQQVVRVAKDIIKGEEVRVADGGEPLMQPSAAQISDLLQDLQPKLVAQGNAKSEYNDKQEALQKLLKAANKLVRRVWAEVESSFAADRDAGSRRAKAEQWGVMYGPVKRKRKKTADTDNRTLSQLI